MIQQMPAPCPVEKHMVMNFKVAKTVPCIIPTSEPIVLNGNRRLTEFFGRRVSSSAPGIDPSVIYTGSRPVNYYCVAYKDNRGQLLDLMFETSEKRNSQEKYLKSSRYA